MHYKLHKSAFQYSNSVSLTILWEYDGWPLDHLGRHAPQEENFIFNFRWISLCAFKNYRTIGHFRKKENNKI